MDRAWQGGNLSNLPGVNTRASTLSRGLPGRRIAWTVCQRMDSLSQRMARLSYQISHVVSISDSCCLGRAHARGRVQRVFMAEPLAVAICCGRRSVCAGTLPERQRYAAFAAPAAHRPEGNFQCPEHYREKC
eukprot:364859-Chlamydomonas_euryale.AAC.3